MAADLIKSKKYIGKTIASIREELGNWDGYFGLRPQRRTLCSQSEVPNLEGVR